MSAKLMGEVWELDIRHQHAWVLMSLCDHAEHDGSGVFPGNPLTAWKTGYSIPTIKRVLRELKDEYGLIEQVKEGGGSRRTEWRIVTEKFDDYRKPMPSKRGRPKKAETNQIATPKDADESDKNRGQSRREKGGQNNRGQNKPGLNDEKPGSPTRAHDDENRPIEPSSLSEGSNELTGGGDNGVQDTQDKNIAKQYLTITIDRMRDVDFEPNRRQIATLGAGFKRFVLVGEGETPPSKRDVMIVINKLVETAAAGFFWSVEKTRRELAKSYRGGAPILRDVSMSKDDTEEPEKDYSFLFGEGRDEDGDLTEEERRELERRHSRRYGSEAR